jgi:hypothetical protein
MRSFKNPAVLLGLSWSAALAAVPSSAATTGRGLMILSTDNVILRGEQMQVSAFAQIPDDAFAFAAAEFDVAADIPTWTRVSGGFIAGARVIGIEASQAHNPPNDPADPTNPFRIWSGTFAPASGDAQLVELKATPRMFAYYPDEGSRLPVECAAAAGRDWLLVNPLESGGALLAPAPGTAMIGAGVDIMIAEIEERLGREGNDVLLGGAGIDFDGVQVGLLIPEAKPIRLIQQTPLDGLTIAAEVERAAPENDDCPTEIITMAYSKGPGSPTYDVTFDAPTADAVEVNLNAFGGQTMRLRFEAADAATAMLRVARIPDAYSVSVQPDPGNGCTRMVYHLDYNQPVMVVLGDGSVRTIRNMEVHGIQNNLRQLGIGVHNVGMHGAGKVIYRDFEFIVK